MNSVIRHSVTLALAIIALNAVATAQDSPVADAQKQVLPERATLLPERLAFCKKFYGMNDGEVEKLRVALETKLLLHRDYMRDHQIDLRRLTATIAVALPQQDTSKYTPEQKERFRAHYQDKIYRIYEAAPMSLAYAVQQAEEIVGADRAQKGRTEIATFFKPVLGDKSLDTARMDRLILKPVKMEDISMSDDLTSAQAKLLGSDARSTPPRDPKKVQPPAKVNPAPTDVKQKTTLSDRPQAPKKNPAPPEVPANLRNQAVAEAPPVDAWAATYQTWTKNYGFSDEQNGTAESIYEYTHRKALEYMAENKNAIEAVRGKDEAKTKELMTPVLNLFNQMKSRIDNVATLEQRAKWAQAQQEKDGA